MAYLQDTTSAFNPGIAKTSDPDYLKLSKSIDQPSANTFGAEVLKTGAEVFGSSVKFAHDVTQEGIGDEEYQRLNAERSKFTSDIDNVYNTLVPTKVTDQALDVLSTIPGGAKMPQAVADAPKVLNDIEAARPGGKYSQSYLDMKYDSVLKDLRSRYPGWREYIDDQAHKITGRDPANDYIKQRIADVNAWAAKAASEKDKTISKLYGMLGEHPDVPVYIKGVETGVTPTLEANLFINKTLAFKHDMDRRRLIREDFKGSQEMVSISAESDAQREISQMVTDNLNTLLTGQEKDSEKLFKSFSSLTGPQALQVAQQWEQNAVKLEAGARAKLNTRDANGKSYIDYFGQNGQDKANKMIKENMQLHKDVIGYLKDQQIGPMVTAKRLSEMYQDQDTLGVMESDLGRSLGVLHTIENKLGKDYALVLPNIMTSNLTDKLNAFLTEKNLLSTAGVVNPKTGEGRSLPADISELQKKFPETKVRAVAADKLIKQAELINKPISNEIKLNAVNYVYNQGLIDLVQPDTNRLGKNSLYSELLSDDKLREVKKLGGAAWEKVVNWGKNTFGNELLKPALLGMSNLHLDKLSPNLSFQWDNEKNNFKVINSKGDNVLLRVNTVRSLSESISPNTQRTLNNINQNLDRLSAIAKIDGTDVSKFLWDEMINLGYDPIGTGGPKNIPEQILTAIKASQEQAEKNVNANKEVKKRYGF